MNPTGYVGVEPNITGGIAFGGPNGEGWLMPGATGSFVETTEYGQAVGFAARSGSGATKANFSAKRTCSMYGKSESVQSAAFQILIIIKI